MGIFGQPGGVRRKGIARTLAEFHYRNKKKDRNKKNSINRVKRIRETEDEFDKNKFKQSVERIYLADESTQKP